MTTDNLTSIEPRGSFVQTYKELFVCSSCLSHTHTSKLAILTRSMRQHKKLQENIGVLRQSDQCLSTIPSSRSYICRHRTIKSPFHILSHQHQSRCLQPIIQPALIRGERLPLIPHVPPLAPDQLLLTDLPQTAVINSLLALVLLQTLQRLDLLPMPLIPTSHQHSLCTTLARTCPLPVPSSNT